MPDKEKATKLLGFRDDSGALVCPADVVDPAKSYTCHIGAEDGSFEPSDADLKTIGELFAAVGLDASCTKAKGKGGSTFKNKKGVIVCRMVEGKSAPAPKKPEPAPEPEALREVDTKPEEEVTAAAEAKVEVKKAPAKKGTSKKKAANKRKK